jgi:hypothetical protein
VGRMDTPLRLCRDPLHFRVRQVTHNVNIMGGKIEDHANIAHTRREGAKASCMQMKEFSQLALCNPSLQLNDGRIETLDVAYRDSGTFCARDLNQGCGLLNGTGHWLFDQHVNALMQQV